MPPHNQHPENGPLEELTPEALLAGAYRDGGEAAYAAELQRQQLRGAGRNRRPGLPALAPGAALRDSDPAGVRAFAALRRRRHQD